ncbi:pyruvate, water dikinase regulatory protein [Henriciella litoralis]|uniref:pyruvate, water dikinase regulatory protein n=1 Tax=Henriciella litoralis TaxID=568102 RepID=UPI000A04E673|nr:pyruvate, water dikinase regulatory protein [Henriciella litoralis]
MRPSIYFNVHLVSDSTGETLNAVMRAAAAQFENVMPLEHNYYLVRSERQLERVMREIEAAPGVVWFTISDEELRVKLEQFCRTRQIPTLPVLDPSIHLLSRHLGVSATDRVAGQHALNAEYFERIEAINFALAHDDGQNLQGLVNADVVLLGVSRTSKTPTCVYLANRGVKAGNIPLVPGVPTPDVLDKLDPVNGPLVVGLKIGVERLVQIRSQRLMALNENSPTDYTDEEIVRAEVTEASRLFQRKKWAVIDVSRRSVEETAAAILNKLNQRHGQ